MSNKDEYKINRPTLLNWLIDFQDAHGHGASVVELHEWIGLLRSKINPVSTHFSNMTKYATKDVNENGQPYKDQRNFVRWKVTPDGIQYAKDKEHQMQLLDKLNEYYAECNKKSDYDYTMPEPGRKNSQTLLATSTMDEKQPIDEQEQPTNTHLQEILNKAEMEYFFAEKSIDLLNEQIDKNVEFLNKYTGENIRIIRE